MRSEAYAKVNLSLRVGGVDATGLHSLLSLVRSIDWPDTIDIESADEDVFRVAGGGVPENGTNLVVRALEAVRSATGRRNPVAIDLIKRIPVAAGLGGGSADAAATLVVAAIEYGLGTDERDSLADGLGADVPFCLLGGSALVEGHGERLTPLADLASDHHLAVVVPPFELPTGEVFRRWDALEGPAGQGIGERDLPVSLRNHAPLVNDLVPAAVDLRPELGDWIADLRSLWGQPVAMSGSGPSLFGFFPASDEAEGAVAAVAGARDGRACEPADRGGRILREEG